MSHGGLLSNLLGGPIWCNTEVRSYNLTRTIKGIDSGVKYAFLRTEDDCVVRQRGVGTARFGMGGDESPRYLLELRDGTEAVKGQPTSEAKNFSIPASILARITSSLQDPRAAVS